jgi:hypothetical protein
VEQQDRPPRRLWLVGERNPYGADPFFALYPLPRNAAGGRLCRVLGMTADRYLEAFERRNLMPHDAGRWSAPAARAAADALLEAHPTGHALVLLGARVSAAFGVDYASNTFAPRFMQVGDRVLRGRRVLVLPHPSGRSRAWNHPDAAALARGALEMLRSEVTFGDGPCSRDGCPFARCADPEHHAAEGEEG